MSNRILSYRGLLADGGQDRILLSTIKGEKGYRIIKLQAFSENPGSGSSEICIKVYKTEQTSITNNVNFSDNRLLAVATFEDDNTLGNTAAENVIFDNEIFNQDIFITSIDTLSSNKGNYYLELEVIMLNESEAMVATLKDIRNNS